MRRTIAGVSGTVWLLVSNSDSFRSGLELPGAAGTGGAGSESGDDIEQTPSAPNVLSQSGGPPGP
ncbi:MAG: hypothetical protein ACREA9_05930, partial [Pyrinomonadaceae bacterium]